MPVAEAGDLRKEQGQVLQDALWVGLQSDPAARPSLGTVSRAEARPTGVASRVRSCRNGPNLPALASNPMAEAPLALPIAPDLRGALCT
jgi:hypothetical protein